jgi:hypothetical protein
MSGFPQDGLPLAVEKQLHTTHVSNSVRVHYPHHPHFGDLVQVIRPTSSFGPNQAVLLLPNGKRLVVPMWMLDEERCKEMQIMAQPVVAVDALFALRDLLQSQRLPVEEKLTCSDKPLPGGVSIEAKQTRATLRAKSRCETSRNRPAGLPPVVKPDVPGRDRRKSKNRRGGRK